MDDRTADTLPACDRLRTPDSLHEPDMRHGMFSRPAPGGGFEPLTAAAHVADVAAFELDARVPEAVRIHFETARNLYAYAWFVYRFYPVAQQHALASLEFALRERLSGELLDTKRRMGLSNWLQLAKQRGVIANERFSWRAAHAMQRARVRAELQLLDEMQRNGLTVARLDSIDVTPLPEDADEDWLGTFIATLPRIRNELAHGSSHLHDAVLRTFEIVRELIDQLFTPPR